MKKYRVKNRTSSRFDRIKETLLKITEKIKLGIAIFLDLIDLILGNIPLLNSLWDIVTFGVLFLILKNKNLAFFANIELLLPGIPLFGIVDAFIPIATILTLADIGENKIKGKKTSKKNKVIDMEVIKD